MTEVEEDGDVDDIEPEEEPDAAGAAEDDQDEGQSSS